MTKVDNSPGAAIGNLFKSIGNEAGRAVKEAGRHVTESINDITKAVETGGIVGGAVAFYDKTSLGNMAAGAVDTIFPGKDLPKPLMEGISAYVNLATGNPMGFVDVVQGFMALAGPSKKPAEQQPGAAQPGQQMQSPQSPSEAIIRQPTNERHVGYSPTEIGGGFISRKADGGVVLSGTAADDKIRLDRQSNGSYKLTVNGESMNISARDARNLTINSGAGNDTVVVIDGNNVTVNGGSGNDHVAVRGDNAQVNAGRGNDRVYVTGDNAKVNGDRGNDRIRVGGDNALISGGRGNDKVRLAGDNGRVFGGRGNDVLRAMGDTNVLKGGRGNDVVRNEKSGSLGDHFKFDLPKNFLDRARDIGAGGGFTVNDGLTSGTAEIIDLLRPGKETDATQKKIADMQKRAAEATAELDKILNNPDLSFEDMIFMLMGALMKQAQKEVKSMTAETREKKAAFDQAKIEMSQGIDAAESKVNELEAKVRADPNNKDAAKELGTAKSELRKLGEERNEKVSEFNDSRQEQLEAIKNAMNKITEMQQTLSNILNSMHQTAMSTIGNIR